MSIERIAFTAIMHQIYLFSQFFQELVGLGNSFDGSDAVLLPNDAVAVKQEVVVLVQNLRSKILLRDHHGIRREGCRSEATAVNGKKDVDRWNSKRKK